MALTFADTYNMIAYLTKSDASEGFDQIFDFLNASSFKYALTRIAWNEFSSFMASAVICLATGRKFNFSKYIFESLVRNVDSSLKFYMYPRFLQLVIRAQVGDLYSHSTKYTSLALTQKQAVVDDVVADSVPINDVPATDAETTPPSPPPTTPPPPQELPSISQAEVDVAKDAEVEKNADVQRRQEESQAKVYHIDLEHADKVLSMQDDEPEPDELQEVIEVVTTAKLMTKVVTATAPITAALSAAKRRKGKQAQIEQDEAYARELEAELNKNINWDDVIEQVKEKGKQDNAMLRYQELMRKPQTKAQARKNIMVYLKNIARFKMDYFKGMSYDDICPMFENYFNLNVAFLEKSKEELEEEESRALKRKTESSDEKAVKKQKLDEEVEELKNHLQIVPNDDDDDDVYTEATPLALKVPVVDYEIYSENNKPFYKIIRADGSHQLFLRFLSLLSNFDREDLDMLWQMVQERFASLKPKNFSDDFLLTTLKYIFEKPDVEAQV
uniref:Leucine-rich repeat protein n=1 Tax=Tanacetum cinerariifolium TaxID=118510 RepID=A0A699HHK1_TANCI|nr:leucine-rich repeat protein [Tanacetum cinerariifolium]